MAQKRIIRLKNEITEYELEIKNVKNINLHVRRDGTVYVSANRRVPISRIDDFIRANAGFISRTLEKSEALEKINDYDRVPYDGARMRIFGDVCTVHILYGNERIYTSDGAFYIYTSDISDEKHICSMYESYKSSRLISEAEEYCERFYPYFYVRGIPRPLFRLKSMRSKWGYCDVAKGLITLNSALCEANGRITELIVAHEMSHLLCHDHSRKFYGILAELIPDFREREKELKLFYPF